MSRLSWVRGNSVLMAVTLTQIKTDGTEEAIDLSVYDAWAVRVLRVSSYKREVQDGVTASLDIDGHIILSIASTLPCGSYSVEVTMEKESSGGATDNGTAKRRSYELPVFSIVESNGESDVTYDVVEGMLSADIEMRFQLLPIAETLGKNAYELWKELPGHEDKTLQEYIDEVLDLNTITAECEAAIVIATHPDYIGEDNYVYHWTNSAYVKTDIYCKGDPGTGGEVDWDDITDKPTFATVATSGSYNDLSNKPTIPAAQVQSDWNATTGMGVILNKPTIPTVPTNVSAFTNDAGYTTNIGTITGITMNGASKGTSGVVDLGTVITSHQDISGKEDKLVIDSTAKTASFTASVGKYYTVNVANDSSVAVTLPTTGFTTTDIQSIVFLVTLGSGTASCTFSPVAMTAEGSLDASSTYEVNALWNGTGWYVSFVKLTVWS